MAVDKKKSKEEPRRRSIRLQSREEDKKRTNLKDLLNNNSKAKRKSGIEQDGDFIFKRTASQLGDDSETNRSKSSTSAINSKKSKIRKITAKDINVTPQSNKPKRSKNINDYEEHSTSIQLALPISDTPIIRRNKELRNDSRQQRRSSLGNRGKRVSSIGNGFTAVPHDRVPTTEFYKHLDSSLPDPHKMRQLLSWCAKRVFEEDKNKHIKRKNKLPTEELTALNIAKVIKEELVRDLTDGKISSSWWNRDKDEDETDNGEAEKILLPNEKNVKNAQVLQQLKERLDALQKSSAQWESGSLSKQIELPFEVSLDKIQPPINDDSYKKAINSLSEISQAEESTFNELSQNLQLSLDTLGDIVHKLNSSSSIRNKYTSLKSAQLSNILDSTLDDQTLSQIPHNEVNKDIDTNMLLKGISRLDR